MSDTGSDGARRTGTRRVYEGKVLALDVDEVVEPGEVRATREVVRHAGSVAALAVEDDGRVALVRQYRYAVGEAVWELPAGRIDKGETPEQAVVRELEEEAGVRPGRIERFAFFYTTPGFCDEKMYVFRATGLAHVTARPEEDERIELRWFTPPEIDALLDSGEIREGKTLVALLKERLRRA
ncbi:MAG TPA: NUDIX hydrolase [Vicinamibacteria bacterium]|nr:NUDIX hydrolase [Vicinamibacteria bacterium]